MSTTETTAPDVAGLIQRLRKCHTYVTSRPDWEPPDDPDEDTVSIWSEAADALSRLAQPQEAAPVTVQEDGRPMNTDQFLVKLFAAFDDPWDRIEAIDDWLHGNWESAMWGIASGPGQEGGEG